MAPKKPSLSHRHSMDNFGPQIDLRHESATDRTNRLERELEEKRVSDAIDKAIAEEAKELRKRTQSGQELEVLLLGATGAGKTTFLKQLRLQYDSKGLDAEREATRLVILLTLCQSVRILLSLLSDSDPSSDPLPPSYPTNQNSHPLENTSSSNGRPLSPAGTLYRAQVRLAPILELENPLRETLGVFAVGASKESFSGAARDLGAVKELVWRDGDGTVEGVREEIETPKRNGEATPRGGGGTKSRQQQTRSRAASPSRNSTGSDGEPMLTPSRLAERMAALAFGNSSSSRRAKAQGTSTPLNPSSANWTSSGKFLASPEDPIHIVSALRSEIESLWEECISKGLIAGLGPMSGKLGGFELSESARYFLGELERIAKAEWLPNDGDLLNVRVRTCGIETHHLSISPTQSYRICDPAGARGIKHAWAPYFENSAAIIFVAAVSDYNIANPENPLQNRLVDALDLFEDVASNGILKGVVIITFMNKLDIVRRKVKSGIYPLSTYFPKYKGGTKSQEVMTFFQKCFEERHAGRNRPLYIFATQANDSKSIKLVVAAVNDILMRSNLAASGLL